ncbi:MAG: biopolymer transporter ExbD [Gammaproteobacteria bacterium]|nr:biopolymer transporter ExbD [Gammaproteobacteria bacterium]
MNLRPRRVEPPRVDITPLIDVVFLMLIFFMVSTTFEKETQLKVDLPEASTLEAPEQNADKIEITIDAQGQYYVNERELVKHDALTLHRTLQKIADGRNDIAVIVSGDRNAPLQAMMTVLDVAARLELTRLSFVARQADVAAE